MKNSRFSEEQIISILKQQESGRPTGEVCREAGISSVGALWAHSTPGRPSSAA